MSSQGRAGSVLFEWTCILQVRQIVRLGWVRKLLRMKTHYDLRFTIYDRRSGMRLTKKTFTTCIDFPFSRGSFNGKTADSGSAYRSSNPCLPAKPRSKSKETAVT